MMKFLLLLISVLLVPALISCEGEKDSNVMAPKRSKRWDAYIQSLKDAHKERRVRRQAGAQEWESDRANCNPATYTTHDTKGRRGSDSLIATPQDQGDCGSCWAFSSIHTLTDQLSLTLGTRQPLLSANHLTLCNKEIDFVGEGNGCCGGDLAAGPFYFWTDGVVSNECSPYGDDVSSYNANIFKRDPNRPLPNCPSTCADGSSLIVTSYFDRLDISTLDSEQDIIDALEAGSVVLAGMKVTDEFFMYECGVYIDSGETDVCGGHAVEIVDYGTTPSGVDFWVAKNSWGVRDPRGQPVQENGFFRIARGELQIAEEAILLSISADPDPALALPTNVPEFGTCTEAEVNDPMSNEMVRSVEEFVRQQLISMNLVSCRPGDGGTPTELTLNTITSADTQVVAGTNVDVDFTATVVGCEQRTMVDISASVMIDLDDTFTLESRSITIRSSSNNSAKNFASLYWTLLVFAAALVILIVQE